MSFFFLFSEPGWPPEVVIMVWLKAPVSVRVCPMVYPKDSYPVAAKLIDCDIPML